MNFEESNGVQYGAGIKAVIYGQEGVGKSTLAANLPGAVFIDCEGSTSKMNVRRLQKPTSWTMLCEEMQFILAKHAERGYRSVIIDTFDWAERLALDELCAEHKVNGIEGMNYGKGWQYEAEKIGRFLDMTEQLIAAGINVIFLCHAISSKVTLPEEVDEFDHWELKLGNKTTNKIAPLLKEWSDMTLFLAFRANIIATDDKGKKHKATSMERVMYTTKTAWWDAKNRFGLPDSLPLDYSHIAHIFGSSQPQNTAPAPAPQTPPPVQLSAQQMVQAAQAAGIPTEMAACDDGFTDITPPYERVQGIPDALADLMEADRITAAEVERACSTVKGYMPVGMPLQQYPMDFIQGCLIGAWAQVKSIILNDPQNVPFV